MSLADLHVCIAALETEAYRAEGRFAMTIADMQARLAALEAENKALRDRLAEEDTVKNAALNCVREATGAVMRLAPLEAEAKQAREDEAWALKNQIDVKALEHGKWKLTWWCDKVLSHSFDDSFHAALRALREKVEAKP